MNPIKFIIWRIRRLSHKYLSALISLFIFNIIIFSIIYIELLHPEYLIFAQNLSNLIAIIDDLLLRIIGVVLLLVSGFAMVTNEIATIIKSITKTTESKKQGDSQDAEQTTRFASLKWPALLGVSGLSFFAAHGLDQPNAIDLPAVEAEAATVPSPAPKSILARWIQIVPAQSSKCELKVSRSKQPDDDLSFENCPYDFLVRAVVQRPHNCPYITIRSGAKGSTYLQMVRRDTRAVAGFLDIMVCERRLSDDRRAQTVRFDDGLALPVAANWGMENGPTKIVTFGDSGCRDSRNQACDHRNWPLQRLAKNAAAQDVDPDLVIHLGDFLYIKHETWRTWNRFFFEPSRDLLQAAPWIMVRGNHERCGEHGDAPNGFYLFFDTQSHEVCRDDAERLPTYALDLSSDHRIIVADSSTAHTNHVKALGNNGLQCETVDVAKKCDADQQNLAEFKSAYINIKNLALQQSDKETWLITHVPVFALEKCSKGDKSKDGYCGPPKAGYDADSPRSSTMLRAAWEGIEKSGIQVILSGDRHLFQIVKPHDGIGLRQYTIGTGGVVLDPLPLGLDEGQRCTRDRTLISLSNQNLDEGFKGWQTCSEKSFGYLIAERTGQKFQMSFNRVQ